MCNIFVFFLLFYFLFLSLTLFKVFFLFLHFSSKFSIFPKVSNIIIWLNSSLAVVFAVAAPNENNNAEEGGSLEDIQIQNENTDV